MLKKIFFVKSPVNGKMKSKMLNVKKSKIFTYLECFDFGIKLNLNKTNSERLIL